MIEQSSAEEELLMNQPGQDDTCGWGRLLSSALDNAIMGQRSGFLLTGPPGCGKHTAAETAAKALVKKEENELCFVPVSGMKLAEDTDASFVVLDRVKALMDYFSSEDSERGPCFLFDHMEDCFCRREVENMLAVRLRRFRSDQIPMFVFYIMENTEAMSQALKRELRHCILREPDSLKRQDFLENQAFDIEDALTKCRISFDMIVQLTEGFNYRQMDDLLYCIKMWIWKYEDIKLEELHDLVETQKTPESDKDLRHRWMKKMISFMENPPVIMGNTIRGEQSAADNPVKDKSRASFGEAMESEVSLREKLEKLPVDELYDDLFGPGVFDRIGEEMMQANG
jgi:hypothetical protein